MTRHGRCEVADVTRHGRCEVADVTRRRARVLVVLVLLSVVAATAGFVAGRTIRSPARVAADAEPPKPSLITVPVELRELESRVIVRGDVHRQGNPDIGIDPSIGLGTGVPVVTAVTSSGGERCAPPR